jgi:hypothetical protein
MAIFYHYRHLLDVLNRGKADTLPHSSASSKSIPNPKSASEHTADIEVISQLSTAPSIDQQDYSSARLEDYLADPVNPNPTCTWQTIEESLEGIKAILNTHLEAFHATIEEWEGWGVGDLPS